jgi:large subunit ribosomal protein L9
MKVIFLQNVKKLGLKDEVKDVNEGHARNFLIPQKLAVEAGAKALSALAERLRMKEQKIEKGTKEFREAVSLTRDFTLSIKKKANDEGHLFSSVTLKDIVSALKQKGINLEEKDLELFSHIKKTGEIEIPIKNTDGLTLRVSIDKE